MLDNFIFSINATLPLFLTVAVGVLLKRFTSLSSEFFTGCERFVFKAALPCMLFLEVASSTPDEMKGNIPLIAFCVAGIALLCLALCLILPIFVKDRAKVGAMVQGIFRSNFAILGVPIATSMFGDACRGAVAAMLPFVIITFNILAVAVLTVFAPKESRKSTRELISDTLLGIVKNPLIIGIVFGLPFMLFGIGLPAVANKTLGGISDTVTALSLISIGAGFNFSSIKGKIGNAILSALSKTVLVPALMLLIAYFIGLRSVSLGLVFVVFGSPTAVSSYIMAKNMNSDHELSAQILLLSTLFSSFTVFLGMFILKTLELI